MPLKLTDAIDFTVSERKAARKRASDISGVDLAARRLDQLEEGFLQSKQALEPRRDMAAGGLSSSGSETLFVKNAKYQAALMADKTDTLGQHIFRSTQETFTIIDGIERAVASLESDVKESELEIKEGYSKVHYNAFVRHIDADEDFETIPLRRDPKTDVPFLSGHICEVDSGHGITLPLVHEELIVFSDAVLLSEETDRGDTENPLIQTSPRNLFLNGEIFRYSIVKREFDETSRLYTSGEVTCTIQLELAALQLINTLVIEPAATSSVFLTDIDVLSDDNTEFDLEIDVQELKKRTVITFDAIRARYINFTFKQYAPVERTRVVISDQRAAKLNELLESSGFTGAEEEAIETVYGAVYDFSMKSIKGYLRTYNSTGVFSSAPIAARNLIALNLVDDIEPPTTWEAPYSYGAGGVDPLIERYVFVDMKTPDGVTIMRGAVPLRSGSEQREGLPLFGKTSKLSLYPDVYKGLSKARVTASYNLGVWSVSCPDGIPGLAGKPTLSPQSDEDLRFIGPDGSELTQAPPVYTKISSTSLWIAPAGTGNRDAITAATTPYLYAFFASEQTNPITVKEDTTTLVLGTDYQLSFDRGASWVDEIPWGRSLVDGNIAGNVLVKFTDPDYDKFYSVEYAVAKDQWLEDSKTIKLKNFRTMVDSARKKNVCDLHTIYILRGWNTSTYVTPLIENYSLRLRELNVSK